MTKVLDERDFAHLGGKTASFRADDVAASQEFRRAYEARANAIKGRVA